MSYGFIGGLGIGFTHVTLDNPVKKKGEQKALPDYHVTKIPLEV